MKLAWSLYAAKALSLGCLCSAAIAAPSVNSDPTNYHYVVQPGDSLSMLAQNSLVRVADYHKVARINRVVEPSRLQIGSKLIIPRVLLRTVQLEGHVIAFRGVVHAGAALVRIGSVVREGDRVTTDAHAFLSIALNDGTTVTLPSQSVIRINRLRKVMLSGEQDRIFTIEAGRSEWQVTPLKILGERFEVHTTASVASVRGTKFRVSVLDSGAASATAVLSGAVAVTGHNSNAMLIKNTGARTDDTSSVTAALLSAPSFLMPAKVQMKVQLEFTLNPVELAAQYRVQVARDAGFLDIVEEEVSSTPNVKLGAIPNGDFFARATAIDLLGLEGLPRVTAFERYLNDVRTSVSVMPGRRRYLFAWRDLDKGNSKIYRFTLVPAATPDHPVVDEPGMTNHQLTVTDLPPGDYIWHVVTTDLTKPGVYANTPDQNTLTVPPTSHPRKGASAHATTS